ncbi:5'-nucleotidase, lipoprotein e(P4) family [Salinisphaera hydrothermalis]|uniref:5'-nucleotidase n=1 Tax=Salinisphaera hydrothermalis (strain C41B8) TaxID=1304275 RepID=A0A084IQT8_SALHC|nr:5'-nucleotidase, lipoprotein e(P4) family [Salinisphaera hydrothermalis]KEZ79072.1 5'-nucleotidase [Salinisphaera hydrothermalis C41B8]
MTPYPTWLATAVLVIAAAVPSAYADDSAGPGPAAHNPHLMGDRYQQASAEVRALQLQAYNVATRRLDQLLADHHGSRQPAVVLDLDETVLDNSPYEAASVLDGFSFPKHWDQWVDAAEAPLIPGARAFLRHADARGVAIFYVSNRSAKQEAATIANLKRDGLPQVSTQSVQLKGPSKKQRRDAIAQHYDILLLVGDTLHDFDAEFAGTSLASQRAAVMRMRHAFGNRFIVLPNASYGNWTKATLHAWQPPAKPAANTAPRKQAPAPHAAN